MANLDREGTSHFEAAKRDSPLRSTKGLRVAGAVCNLNLSITSSVYDFETGLSVDVDAASHI